MTARDDIFTQAAATADPHVRPAIALLRAMAPGEAAAWLRCGRRIVQGVPVAEAERLMWAELGREAPA